MKEFFKKDLTLKILSIIFAVALWFSINPIKTNYYTVHLTVINEESLKAKGLMLKDDSVSKTVVQVSVRERGEVLKSIKDSDFEVILDLSKVDSVDDRVKPLEKAKYLGGEISNLNNIEIKPKTVTLNLGKVEENPFTVQIETKGDLPEGYEIISKTAEPDTVSIQALESVLNNVGSVKAYVDVTNLKKTYQVRKECKVFDKKGKEMVELSKKLSVDIKIEIGKRVAIIPITEGVPSKDCIEGRSVVNPQTTLITGDFNAIEQIHELQTEPIKLANANKTFTTQVPLKVPEGIKLVNLDREVSATVNIIPMVKKSIEVLPINITIYNKKTGNTLKYEITQPVSIKIKGIAEEIDKVTVIQLMPAIDVEKKDEGTYNIPLEVTLPVNVSQVDDVTVPVKITKGE